MSSINREYKDRLFRFLFGSEEMRKNILQLYNALAGSNHTNAEDIQIYTIDDVLYMEMKNDVAIIMDSYLCLWEQQSTFNPNMPVRGLMYFGKLYSKYIETNRVDIYGRRLMKLPTPRYIVFYNGAEDRPAIEELKLTDAFYRPTDPNDFEWTATVYNLNNKKNEALLKSCKPLGDYTFLVDMIREKRLHYTLEDAVDISVDYCIKNDILSSFLIKHKAEVRDMVLTEFNKELHESNIRAEERAEGRAEGREQGREEGTIDTRVEDIKKIMKSLNVSLNKAMEILELSAEERAEYSKFFN